ncbi:MAG: DUF4421 domain-containing protein [Muribaculaceae bacterium]|nr:DUF4421 domain-containing protein [Muribaculaceae bacterium]
MKRGLNKSILTLLFSLLCVCTAQSNSSLPSPSDSIPRTSLPAESLPLSENALAIEAPLPPDSTLLSLRELPQSAAPESKNWWQLLKKGKLNLSDTTVVYPKFLKFCVDVYNWGDRFFNTYDTSYVEGTGKRWKARLVNEDWTDSYALLFKDDSFRMRMLSEMNVNIGAYLQYMAVSVGYSVDVKTIVQGKKTDHSRFETNFTCALFNFDLYYTRNSGTFIRHFTGMAVGDLIKSPFSGTQMKNLGVSIYYFLNNKKYSQGAAYSFSRYQRKSAGSWMFGFTYSNLDISMDFTTLAPELQHIYLYPSDYLRFHYNSYCALFGYGYNWVFHPKWLFNISVMPSIGFNHCYENASEGSGNQFALNIHGRASLVFNHRSLFAGAVGKITGNWYTSRRLSLFNAVEYLSATVGVRF